MSKIICIVGAHGCGKSTAVLGLAYNLKLNNTKLEIKIDQESIKEHCLGRTIEQIRNDHNFMYDWSGNKFNSLLKSSHFYDVVISDRSPLDSLFYTDSMYKGYENILIDFTKQLRDLEIILLKVPSAPIEDNGFRGLDSREVVYNRAKKVLDENGFKYVEMYRDELFKRKSI